MPEKKADAKRQEELSHEELEAEDAAELPDREAMSLVDPSGVARPPVMEGGVPMFETVLAPQTDGSDVPPIA